MLRDRDRISQVLQANLKRFWRAGTLMERDNNLSLPHEWDRARLKVLILFLSTAYERARSATSTVLNSLIKSAFGDQVFVDVCYFPFEENWPLYQELDLPYVFGNVSGRVMGDYDVILVSNSIVIEQPNLFCQFKFSDFSLWHTQRIDDPEMPFVLLGGSASSCCEVLCGPSLDGKHRGLVDAVIPGCAEYSLCSFLAQAMQTCPKSYKRELIHALYHYPWWYYPYAYEHVYEDDGWAVDEIKKTVPKAPSRVYPCRHRDMDSVSGFARKHLSTGIVNSTTTAALQISQGCAGGGCCSFCQEGNASGGWRERSLDRLEGDLRLLKEWSIPGSVGWFSLNAPYYSHFFDLLLAAAKVVPKLAVIPMRADVIAARPQYFDINMGLGVSHLTFGVEGISERLRNGYLNKQLSEKQLLKAIKKCFQARLFMLKLFFIITGKETKEDFKEFGTLARKLEALRSKVGSQTTLRFQLSYLVRYPGTPLQWDARDVIARAFRGERFLADFVQEINKIPNLQVRITSQGLSHVLVQYLVDVGRAGTKVLQAGLERSLFRYRRYLSSDAVHRLLDLGSELGVKTDKLWEERPRSFVFPSSTIETIRPAYLIRAAAQCLAGRVTETCLATPSKPKNRECQGCGYCSSKKMVEERTKRKLPVPKSVDKVLMAFAERQPRYRLRVTVCVREKYSTLSKRDLFTHFLSRYLRHRGECVSENIHSIDSSHSVKWMTASGQIEYSFGTYIFDVLHQKPLDLAAFRTYYKDKAPEDIECMSLSQVRDWSYDDALRNSDRAIYVVGLSGLTGVKESIRGYDGGVLLAQPSGTLKTKRTYNIEGISDILCSQSPGGDSLMGFSLPLLVNPYLFLASVFKVRFREALQFQVICLDIFRAQDLLLCECGNWTHLNLSTGEISEWCERCLRKVYLKTL